MWVKLDELMLILHFEMINHSCHYEKNVAQKSLIQLSQSPDNCRENVGKVRGSSRRKYLGARQKVDDLFL